MFIRFIISELGAVCILMASLSLASAAGWFFQGPTTIPPLPPTLLVSNVGGSASDPNTTATVVLNPVVAGKPVVISVRRCANSGCSTAPTGTLSITDANSNSCSLVAGSHATAAFSSKEIWVCPNLNTSTTTNDTFTLTDSVSEYYLHMVASQWGGPMAVSPVDDATANNAFTNSSTSTMSVSTAAPVAFNDLVYAAAYMSGSFVTGPPVGFAILAGCAPSADCDAYLAPSNAGTQTAAFAIVGGFTETWGASIAGFTAP